jgi:pyrimidine-specific ribonucleoside hydrolase
VLLGIDREAFMKLLFDSLDRLDRELLLASGGN